MNNPSLTTNPLDYPRYVRGIRPALPESLGRYVEDELEKMQDSLDNMAIAADGSAAARVSQEAIARADADSALASSVTTLTSRVGDNEASIQFLMETVDGEEAVARLTVDVNGKITGFTINGQDSEFIVDASRFAVGDDGDYVFEIVDGVTYIKNAVIQDGSLPGGKLQNDAVGSSQIAPNAVLPEHINVTSLSALSANLGTVTAGQLQLGALGGGLYRFKVDTNGNLTIRSAASGQRLEMDQNGGRVYHANGNLAVRWGIW